MAEFIQFLVSFLSLGGVYALLALGLVVVLRDAAVLLVLIVFLLYRPNGIIATNPEPMR